MNVCLRNTFVCLWHFFGVLTLSAQGPSFYFPTVNNVAPGSTQLIELRAVNLDSVVSMQMVVRWDPKVLKYITIDQFNFGNLTWSNFNSSNAVDSGYIRLQWEGSLNPPGTSLADSSRVFRLRFSVIGQDQSCSAIRVTELLSFPPTNFEIVKVRPDGTNEDYLIHECTLTDGLISVGVKVAAVEPLETEMPISLSPNPFSEISQLNFELSESADAQVIITDAAGRVVLERNFFQIPAGQHGMVIEKRMLGAAGVYSLTLRAGRKIATRKFVLF